MAIEHIQLMHVISIHNEATQYSNTLNTIQVSLRRRFPSEEVQS